MVESVIERDTGIGLDSYRSIVGSSSFQSIVGASGYTSVLRSSSPAESLFGEITLDTEEGGSRVVNASELFQNLKEDQLKKLSRPADTWWSQKQDASVTCAIGPRGKGKTAWEVVDARILWEQWKENGHNNVLLSNFPIDFADISDPDIVKRLSNYDPEVLAIDGGLVVIDEVGKMIPGKRAMSGPAFDAEQVIIDIRKFKLSISSSVQFVSDVTSSFTRQVDFWIRPRIFFQHRDVYHEGKRFTETITAELTVWIWNWSGSVTERPLYHLHFPPDYDTAQGKITFANVLPILNMYSTDDPIITATRKDRAELMESMDRLKQDREIEDALFGGLEDDVAAVPFAKVREVFATILWADEDPAGWWGDDGGEASVREEVNNRGWQCVDYGDQVWVVKPQ